MAGITQKSWVALFPLHCGTSKKKLFVEGIEQPMTNKQKHTKLEQNWNKIEY